MSEHSLSKSEGGLSHEDKVVRGLVAMRTGGTRGWPSIAGGRTRFPSLARVPKRPTPWEPHRSLGNLAATREPAGSRHSPVPSKARFPTPARVPNRSTPWEPHRSLGNLVMPRPTPVRDTGPSPTTSPVQVCCQAVVHSLLCAPRLSTGSTLADGFSMWRHMVWVWKSSVIQISSASASHPRRCRDRPGGASSYDFVVASTPSATICPQKWRSVIGCGF